MPAEDGVLAGIVHKTWGYSVWQDCEDFRTNVFFVSRHDIFSIFGEHPSVRSNDADVLGLLYEVHIFQEIPHIP